MAIRELIPQFIEHWKSYAGVLGYNRALMDIYDGDILSKVDDALCKMFTQKDGTISQSYWQIKDRIVPINILQRIIDKKSRIYQRTPVREVVGGTDQDKDLVSFYEEGMRWNRQMNIANEYFNLFKYAAVEPLAAVNGRLLLRPVANDAFLPFSVDRIDPTRPTHMIVFHGMRKKAVKGKNGKPEEIDVKTFRAYSDAEWVIFDEEGKVLVEEMEAVGNPDGTHSFGRLPFTYINRDDQRRLIPKPNSDMLAMSILIPLFLSDLSFALKFQCFSIMYAIDLKDQNLTIGPNVFWMLESDPKTDQAPKIGSIKPEVDTDKALSLIQAILSMWLQSMGIRPGAVGQLTADNFASGVSKMIDEMDTSDDRTKQVEFFRPGEEDLWNLVLKHQHPVWSGDKLVENQMKLSPGSSVAVSFPEQLPMVQRTAVIQDIKEEIDLGIEDRRGAKRRLDPHMTDKEVDEYLRRIDESKAEEGITNKALNGIQVSSMVDVVAKIASGEIPRESGIEIIAVSFALDRDTAARIIANAGAGFEKGAQQNGSAEGQNPDPSGIHPEGKGGDRSGDRGVDPDPDGERDGGQADG